MNVLWRNSSLTRREWNSRDSIFCVISLCDEPHIPTLGDFRLSSCPISTDVNNLRTLAFRHTIDESHPCLILRSRLVHRLNISNQRLAQFCRYIYIKIVHKFSFLLFFIIIHIFPNLPHIVL